MNSLALAVAFAGAAAPAIWFALGTAFAVVSCWLVWRRPVRTRGNSLRPIASIRRRSAETSLHDRLNHPDVGAVLQSLPIGIAVFVDGAPVYANELTRRALDASPDVALLGGHIRFAAATTLTAGPTNRVVDLFGPPPRVYVVESSLVEIGHDAKGPDQSVDDDDRSIEPVLERSITTATNQAVVIVVRDISELIRTEAVRRDFVSNISHELKTPVGAIGLLAETMNSTDDPAIATRFARRISGEVERLSNTIDDLLALTEIEFGSVDLERAVDLEPIVGDVAQRLRSAAELRGVDIEVRSDGPALVGGDERQLMSAIFNIVDNAIKYSDAETRVVVEIGTHGDPHASEGEVRVVVTDSGIGIPSGDIDRIFERFYRVDRARGRGTGGTGLGLSIVRNVTSAHGGSVTVESTEGVGSTFAMRLPRLGSAIDPAPRDTSRDRSEGFATNGGVDAIS